MVMEDMVDMEGMVGDMEVMEEVMEGMVMEDMVDMEEVMDMDTKGLFINYVIFFWTIPDPYPPLCHLVSSFDIPPPTPLSDDVIYERKNDMSMIDYF